MEKTKVCTKCKRELFANKDYFYTDKHIIGGLISICKECKGQKFGKTKLNPHIIDLAPNGFYTCRQCKKILPLSEDYFFRNSKKINGFFTYCKECHSKNTKIDAEKNKIKYAEVSHIKYLRNKKNPKIMEKRKLSVRKYAHSKGGKEVRKTLELIRRSKKRNVLICYKIGDWRKCLEYFNNCDAYTGLKLIKASQDHIVPINKNGLHVNSNIIPCEVNINSKKQDREMEQWFKEQTFFSQKRLDKIYKWMGMKNNIQQLSIF